MESWDIGTLDLQPHHPQVLYTDDESRAIAINLPAGEQLQEHQVHETSYLLVTAGQIELEQGGRTTAAGPGFLARFEPHERREVRATTDARLLLILAPYPAPGRRS